MRRDALIHRIEKIENHYLHPMFRTRDAINGGKSDQEVISALRDDLGWFDDIFNETEAMCRSLIHECEQSAEEHMSMPNRIQRKRTAGWRKPENCVCVTRPGAFGNPFSTAAAFERWLAFGHVSVDELQDRTYIPLDVVQRNRLAAKRVKILERLPELRGKHLACFCAMDHACHADVLLRLANVEG